MTGDREEMREGRMKDEMTERKEGGRKGIDRRMEGKEGNEGG